MKKILLKMIFYLLALMIILTTFTACGKQYGTKSVNDESSIDADDLPLLTNLKKEGLDQVESPVGITERKVVFTTNIDIETKEYDYSIKILNELITKYDGYIESSDVYNNGFNEYIMRSSNFVIRIPQDKYQKFLSESGNIGAIVRSKQNNEDITDKYFDVEARLETLKVMEERLLILLEKSETITDIVELEKSLSETRYEIENLTGTLRKYDSLISYSTATISINEVEKITETKQFPRTFGQKIGDSFKASMHNFNISIQNFIIAFIYALPVLILLAIILAIVLIIVFMSKKKKKSQKVEISEKNDKNSK